MTFSIFTPIVTVTDDATIGVDWGDSYNETYDEETGLPVTARSEHEQRHTTLLDQFVADRPAAEGLRALASYIDSKNAAPFPDDPYAIPTPEYLARIAAEYKKAVQPLIEFRNTYLEIEAFDDDGSIRLRDAAEVLDQAFDKLDEMQRILEEEAPWDEAEDAAWGDPEGDEAVCRHCTRRIINVNGKWVDPRATGDDGVWRETCDAHDTFTAEHEPTVDDRPVADVADTGGKL